MNNEIHPAERDRVSDILDQFEAAWHRVAGARATGKRDEPWPSAAAFLPPVDGPRFRRAVCAALVQIELEHRLNQGEAACIEDYLERFPELCNHSKAIRALINTEFRHALDLGRVPAIDDYKARFPAHCDGPFLDRLRLLHQKRLADPRRSRYHRLTLHRRGGLGEVFKVYDRPLQRYVALKQVRPERADGAAERGRLEREAETLGILQHPSIVPIHVRGRRRDGSPYFVMPFLGGENLDDAIQDFHKTDSGAARDGRERGLRKLVGHLIDVCNATAYAHNLGVMHLDLKPGNVMLGYFGETLVIDWGLARPFDPSPRHDSMRSNLFSGLPDSLQARDSGSAVGTPGYMSPEQAANRPDLLGPGSDIYSLGATLYHVLTGRPPFNEPTLSAVIKKIMSGEFPKPSTVRPDVSLALEAVCLKAMSLNPQNRYERAQALAEDLDRWRAGDQVLAYKAREPLTDRVLRWARRHRTAGAAAFAFATAVAFGLVVILSVQARYTLALAGKNGDLKVANQRAERAAETARSRARIGVLANNAIVSTVREDKELADPAFKGLRDRLLRLIFKNLEQWKSDLDQHHDDDPHTLGDLAGAYVSFATISSEISSKLDALRANEQARSLVKEALKKNSARDPRETFQAQLDLAAAEIRVGEAEREVGKTAEAVRCLEQGRVLLEELARRDPGVPDIDAGRRDRLARALMSLGRALREAGDPDAASATYKQALALLETSGADQPDDLQIQVDRAGLLNNLGNVWFDAQPTSALEFFGKASGLYKTVVARATERNDPRRPEFRREEAICSFNLGRLQSKGGLYTAAFDLFEQSRVAQEELVSDDPARSLLRSDLAATHFELAELQARKHANPNDVLASFSKAVEIQAELVNERPDFPQFRYELALTNYRTGIYDWKVRNSPAEAKRHIEAAIGSQEILVAENPGNIKYQLELAKTRDYLAILLDEAGEHGKASDVEAKSIETLKRALAALRVNDRETTRQLSIALLRAILNQGYSYLKSGDYINVVASVERAMDVFETKFQDAPEDRFLSVSRSNIKDLLDKCESRPDPSLDGGRTQDLTKQIRKVRARAEKLAQGHHPEEAPAR